jgi:hypothetical protein
MTFRAAVLYLNLTALLGASCPQTSDTPVAVVAERVFITLERGPCLGSCPVYRLRIFDTGRVEYEGLQHVMRSGAVTDSVNVARIEELRQAFVNASYATLAPRYGYGEPTCRLYVADAVTVVTSIELDGRVIRVEHDHGCTGVPQALTALEDSIDRVVESWRWTTGRRP